MSKNCKHEWLPLGNDRWSCKHCATVKVGYVAELEHQLAEKDDFIKTLGFKNEDKFREYVLNCLLNKEDKANRIRELEQQLAVKDKLITGIEESRDMAVNSWCKNKRKYEAQLAEKDKEIETIKLDLTIAQNDYNMLKSDYIKMRKELFEELKDQPHQLCEKINDYIDKLIIDRFGDETVRYLTIDVEDFTYFLEELEKGE